MRVDVEPLFLDEHGVTHLHEWGIDLPHMVCGYFAWKRNENQNGHRNARGHHPTCLWCVIRRSRAL